VPFLLQKRRRYGYFFGCPNWPNCTFTQAANQVTKNPRGTPADADVRKARIEAHNEFDPLWKSGALTRSEAYHKLASELGVDVSMCHIGMFDLEQCSKAVEVAKKLRKIFLKDLSKGEDDGRRCQAGNVPGSSY
jgi:ssDNA-binding Zn-finger/Zn-ribbon topoisomerase 1